LRAGATALKRQLGAVESGGVDERPPRRPEDTLRRVRETFERTWRAGEVIYEPGSAAASLFLVQAGEVELARAGPEGWRTVARLGPGDLFGELPALAGGPRRERARAVGEARVLELEATTLETMCRERPEIALSLLRRLAHRVCDLEQRLAVLGADELARPLARVLLRAAGSGAGATRSLRGLAAECGLSLLEAHRALEPLLAERWVRLGAEGLEVVHAEALSIVAQGVPEPSR
jgi:CRP-like cAMP-binding protein